MISVWYPSRRMFVFREAAKGADPPRDDVLLDFRIDLPDGARIFSFRRPCDDHFGPTVHRIKEKLASAKCGPSASKKARKRAAIGPDQPVIPTADVAISLLGGGSIDSLNDKTNEHVFLSGAIDGLRIDESDLKFVFNPKDVYELKIALRPLVGCPILASVKPRNGCSVDDLRLHWFVEDSENSSPIKLTDCSESSGDCHSSNSEQRFAINGWTWKTTGPTFTPTSQDAGKRVCVVAYLGEDTIVRVAVTSDPVQGEMTEPFIWEERQSVHCAEHLTGNRLRIMSYNILASLYPDLKLPQDQLFFPYCEKAFQAAEYRYSLLLREIPGYKADLICLQEVDHRFSMRYLTPLLNSIGYEALYRMKGGVVTEGSTIAFNRKRFELLSTHDRLLTDLLNECPENEDLRRVVKQTEQCTELVANRPACIQLLALKPLEQLDRERILLVGNTHLHFNPIQEHVKLIQTALCARHLLAVHSQLRQQHPTADVSIVFAGDLNSVPSSAVYQLLSTGHSPSDHKDWRWGAADGQPFFGIDLQAEKGLHNSTGCPPYTNYTAFQLNGQKGGFQGCLSYIWTSDQLQAEKVIPLPDHSLVVKYQAIPSPICPSDHLPIIVDAMLS
uniref:Endonuclease/exonuclease/phosphatase domain-containing protein n=1 Tax=Plectus sambesii TaxID=2011161 RepID=A0A914UHP5_9BILA